MKGGISWDFVPGRKFHVVVRKDDDMEKRESQKKPAKKPESRPATASHKKVAKLAKERIAPEDRPFIRAENEDDDGYDPWSDRRQAPPLFERDPWD